MNNNPLLLSEIPSVMQLAFLQTAMLQSKPHLGWLGRVPDEVAVHCRTASIARNPIACGTHAVIGFEIDLLVLDGAPQALHEDVVTPCPFAIHRDANTVAFELCGEGFAGELAALIGVEDGRRSPAGNSLLHGIHAKLHVHRIGQSPSQDLAAVPVHHSAKVQPPFVHSHIGDVHGPNLVGIRHGLIPQQVRVDLVLRMTSTGTRLAVQRRDAHALHQRAHMPAAYAMPLALQQPTQHA